VQSYILLMWRSNNVEWVEDAKDQVLAHMNSSGPPSSTIPLHMDSNCHSLALNLYQHQMGQLSHVLVQLNHSIPPVTVPPPFYTLGAGFLNHYQNPEIDLLTKIRLQTELIGSINGSVNNLQNFIREMQGQPNRVIMPQPLSSDESTSIEAEQSKNNAIEGSFTSMSKTEDSSPKYAETSNVVASADQKELSGADPNRLDDFGNRNRKPTKKRSSSNTRGEQINKFDSKWLSSYNRLQHFKQLTGHTIVPRGYSLDPKLASWVSEASEFPDPF
jgi:hypothetical protein